MKFVILLYVALHGGNTLAASIAGNQGIQGDRGIPGNQVNQCAFPFHGTHCESVHTGIVFASASIDHAASIVSPVVEVNSTSACGWIKIEGNKADDVYILSIHNGHSWNPYRNTGQRCNTIQLFIDTKKQRFVLVLKQEKFVFSSTKVVTNRWTHVCLTWAAVTARLYVNGSLQDSITTPTTSVTVGKVVLGNNVHNVRAWPFYSRCVANNPMQTFIGEMTLLNVWDRQLSAVEVLTVFHGETADGVLKTWRDLLNFTETYEIYKKDVGHQALTRPKPVNWRDDGRCGWSYKLGKGLASECNPDGDTPCCSEYMWCGSTDQYCKCDACVDYRTSSPRTEGLIGVEDPGNV